MKIYSVETGNFKVDGGAMFGVVPKVLWGRLYPVDEKNFCPCAVRSMLIVDGNKKVLVDTGIGNKLQEDFTKHYHLFGKDDLITSLKKIGFAPEDITDVIMTHLHFDHCGGTIGRDNKGNLYPVFPNADIIVSNAQWEAAMNPNLREKPAFLNENLIPIKTSGKLNLMDAPGMLTDNIELRFYNGHTKGLISVLVNTGKNRVVFAGDVIPAIPYIRLPYISAYDIEPLVTLNEKKALLEEINNNGDVLFLQHDINTEACTLTKTKKGIRENKTFKLNEIK